MEGRRMYSLESFEKIGFYLSLLSNVEVYEWE